MGARVPDSSGSAGFARFRFWVCRIRGIHNFVLPNWHFCSSVVVRETAGLNGFRELSETDDLVTHRNQHRISAEI